MTRLDHDSNIRPWVQAAESVGATVRWADFDIATGELPVAAVEKVLSNHTRLVAVTGASNVLGDTGALRVGLAPYNTHAEVDRLLGGIAELI